ncbi:MULTISPECIES: acyltransferase domain-containing protein [unclassified Duganella]|uniref:acyltransferase domain-containing protein n=1 Tax=unclassified Duganella TaxID=2636909 RepID=UPI000E34D6A1|nr:MULTISPECIES: acyltransferase domain-containing protein [unclassified Duganella]RFP18910.1 acyltransferase domain-containing protein [Duganella sp. BJB475]RFP35573.1 acyltransferase domain-containing protein [Duganella sp. BJB476]
MTTSYGTLSRLLLLCPGQGGQHAAMFDLPRSSPSGDAAASALLAGLALADNADIYANRNAQPLIVAATLSMWEAIREFTPKPALVAGYSIGELSAYGVAGALPPQTAVQLAAERAQLMDDCARALPGQTLMSISGLALSRTSALLAEHAFHMSIENGDDACIAGGPAVSAEALERAVHAAGGRSTRLPVEVASHTRYMQAAVAPFAAALQRTAFQPMSAPVLAGIGAMAVNSKTPAVDQLSRQLAETIHWAACMDAAAEAGITYALELGPGAALSRILQNRHPYINTRSVADFRTLDGIRKWLARAAE